MVMLTSLSVDGIRKGEWSAEEDEKLIAYINEHGTSYWGYLPKRAGLSRLGKSCRLRWLNYLRPGLKKGKFTPQEEEEIIKHHAVLGNRWASISKRMPNRTDNDIKNHWNSSLKKRLKRKGLLTHEPITDLTIKPETSKIDEESGHPSVLTSPTIISLPSFSFGSARLLNQLAARISSGQDVLDKIKNILSDPKITSSDDQEENELKKDEFPKWKMEQVSRFMEIDAMDYETISLHECFSFLEFSLMF